jgi:pimeloyl-ACP methyl ester carboxylesterase
MSAITIENDLVHYEVLGRGRPVILLHGWLGSWRYWVPAMQQLSMKYRTYALDLWGFGDSGKDAQRYHFGSQVTLLDQFMEKMGITKAALVGHGLGAAVAARYAVQHADRVPRLMVVSPPLFRMAPPPNPLTSNPPPPERLPEKAAEVAPVSLLDSKEAITEMDTIPLRSEEMKARIRAALERRVQEIQAEEDASAVAIPKPPLIATEIPTDKTGVEITPSEPKPAPPLPPPLEEIPTMPKASPTEIEVQRPNPLKQHLDVLDPIALLEKHVDPGSDMEKLRVEVSKADRVAVALTVESFVDVDTLRDLKTLNMPVVVVYGERDTFLPPPDADMVAGLKEGRTTFHNIPMEDIRHFPMLEAIAPFTRLIMDFLEVPDVTKLAIKKTWERRVR